MKLKLSTNKEIEIKEFKSRKVVREVNAVIFDGVVINQDQKADIPANNMERANDLLVQMMTNLTTEEIDELSMLDYNKIIKAINKIPS